MWPDVLGIREAEDGVDAVVVRDLGVDKEGERDGRRVREARGFDDNVVELLGFVLEGEQRSDQVAADGAADASVVHGDDVFLLLDVLADEGVIDGDGAELVLDNRDELAVVDLEDVVNQRGLAGAQETRHDLRAK